MAAEAFIDGSLFMGMHCSDDRLRRSCKDFFVRNLSGRVVMSLEQVGRCDDLVWRFCRASQDAYYPFMDNLHTDMAIERSGYQEADLRIALGDRRLDGLPMHERLLLAMVIGRDAVLHTASPRLRARTDLPVRTPAASLEGEFPPRLERLYQSSLVLRVDTADL